MNELARFEIPGRLALNSGVGGLQRAQITTPWSRGEVYLHGAQVTAFQRHNEPPLLFLSRASQFMKGKAIRGGIPICFPWFGPRAGDVSHGFARIHEWELIATSADPNGAVKLNLRLPDIAARQGWPAFDAEVEVRMSDELSLIMTVRAKDRGLAFENCLHTYFAVGDVRQITIKGLESAAYVDKLANDQLRSPTGELIRINSQTDRTYLNTTDTVQIEDPSLNRVIEVSKSGSASTVVWNPWTTQRLADLGEGEYLQMVCVESGNVEHNRISLAAEETARLEVRTRVLPQRISK